MWRLKNRTPFAIDAAFERNADGQEFWCIAARGRFEVTPEGSVKLSEQETSIKLTSEYLDESAEELDYDGDFVPFKPCTDIVVKGAAKSTSANSSFQMLHMKVGGVEKQAVLFGPRLLEVNGGAAKLLSQKPVQAETDLHWSKSYGGREVGTEHAPDDLYDKNPVGIGYHPRHLSQLSDKTQVELPLVEDPSDQLSPSSEPKAPMGFGPIQRSWEPRKSFAGTYDQSWRKGRAPLLPLDFDKRFYQCAPPDQVYDGIVRGGEQVTLAGFHSAGAYSFQLPQIILQAKTFLGSTSISHRFNCITVELYADEMAVEMVWNTSVPCNGVDHRISSSMVTVKQASGVSL